MTSSEAGCSRVFACLTCFACVLLAGSSTFLSLFSLLMFPSAMIARALRAAFLLSSASSRSLEASECFSWAIFSASNASLAARAAAFSSASASISFFLLTANSCATILSRASLSLPLASSTALADRRTPRTLDLIPGTRDPSAMAETSFVNLLAVTIILLSSSRACLSSSPFKSKTSRSLSSDLILTCANFFWIAFAAELGNWAACLIVCL
mmetsp:Transcript_14032/g.48383  ORF Transcript_14032/g.48383 Transcript_14032/m.48383 type:complete len:211 (-) Transcript_14032:413-1045(-)